MSGFSDAYELKVLDHFTGNTAFTQPEHWWVSLFIGDPDGAGTEVTGVDYGRVDASFGAAAGGAAANDAEIDFGVAGGDWGEVTHFGIHTTETGGALMASGELSASAEITSGEDVSFPIGDLVLTLE